MTTVITCINQSRLLCLTSIEICSFVIMKIDLMKGAGSGYLTAIFAMLVGETGRAVGVEHIPELTDQAYENVRKSKAAHLLNSRNLFFFTGGQFGDIFSSLLFYMPKPFCFKTSMLLSFLNIS